MGFLSSDSVERGLIPTVVFPWSFSRVEWILHADVTPAARSLLSQSCRLAQLLLENGLLPAAEVASAAMQSCVVGAVPTEV